MIRLALLLLVIVSLAGCGFSARDQATALLKAHQATTAAQADATAWKASDTKHQQQLADQGKSVSQLTATVATIEHSQAELAAEHTQALADLGAAKVSRDRLLAGIAAAIFVAVAVGAYAASDYLTMFAWILRPIAYAAGGLAAAAFLFREIRPYAGWIEAILGLVLLAAVVYELDTRTRIGTWLAALAQRFGGSQAMITAISKAETEVKTKVQGVESWLKSEAAKV